MTKSQFFSEWSALHGGAEVSGVVKGWLALSYLIVKPLHLLKVSPNVITVAGLGLGAITWAQAQYVSAIFLVLLSLIADGIDGSLAIVSKKTTLWGAALDSVVDRVVEFFWALTFYRIGAPVIVIGFAWIAALTQEYVRARAAGLGYREIGVVTVCERPMRAIILALALISYQIFDRSVIGVEIAAWAWLWLQLLSLVVVLRDSYAALRSDNRLSN